MVRDSQGNLHFVWCDDTWRIRHRIKYPNGTFSAITEVSVGQDSTYWVRCAMDGLNQLHITWHRSTGAGIINNEVYHRRRNPSGTWSTQVNVSNTPSTGSIYPDIAVDGLGRVFIAWHESVGNWDIALAIFDAGAWQPMQIVAGSSEIDAYPVLAVDAHNTLHLAYTWDYQEIYYRTRDAAGIWSAIVNVSNASGKSQDPHIAVGYDRVPHIVWHDARTGDWEYFYASTEGGVWQAPVNLSNSPDTTDCYGAIAAGPDGSVHAVWQDYSSIYYSRRAMGATWSLPAMLHTSSYLTKHAVVHVDSMADVHIAWQDKPLNAGWDVLYMTKAYPDQTPPAEVTAFAAIGGNTQVLLNWTNPTQLDYAGTMIRFKSTGYPTGPADGTLLYRQSLSRGSSSGTSHTGLVNGVTCYYAAFTYDDSMNYSPGSLASATPAVPADHDRDGDVDQTDFGLLQLCYSGPFQPPVIGCEGSDLDNDEDVDIDDADALMNAKSGAGNYAGPWGPGANR